MDFFIRIAEKYILANRKLRKLKRAVSVMMAITVFVTTYALILPAITLEKETASAQPGIEIAASDNESDSGGTVSEAGSGEEPPEAESRESGEDGSGEQQGEAGETDENGSDGQQDAGSVTEDSGSRSGSQDADISEADLSGEDNSGRDTESDSGQNTDEQAVKEEFPDAEEAGPGETGEDPAITETLADGETLAVGGAAEESRLITEKTLLTYEYIDEYYEDGIDDENDDGIDDGYFVYAELGADAKLPEGVELSAEEITKESDTEAYEAYYEKALSGLQDKYDENAVLSFARFYDIRFVYNGGEVEPAGDVKVRIEYKKAIEIPKEANVEAVHFDRNNGEEPEVIRSEVNSPEGIGPEGGAKGSGSEGSGAKRSRLKSARSGAGSSGAGSSEAEAENGEDKIVRTVDFESDKFSVYGIVGTVIEKTVLASDGRNYTVTATYGAGTGIPADADLSVEEITESSSLYDEYVSKSENALGWDAGSVLYARVFDIKITDKDDPEIRYQPNDGTRVDVRIELADSEETNKLNVVHFADDKAEGDVLENSAENSEKGSVVEFAAEGFSVYVIVNHEGEEEIVTPRVEFHFIGNDFTEGASSYTASPYNFVNTAGEYQTTQILKDGESLELVVNPPNLIVDDGEGSLSEKFFFGWYVVNETDDTTDLDQNTGKYSGIISYTWPAEDLEKISFTDELTITAPENAVVGGTEVTWTLGDNSDSGTMDEEGTIHVYLAPIYEDFYFVNFRMGPKEDTSGLVNKLLDRKLVVFGSGDSKEIRIGDIECSNTDPQHKIFVGWESRRRFMCLKCGLIHCLA